MIPKSNGRAEAEVQQEILVFKLKKRRQVLWRHQHQLHAGGADATVLRALLRKSALEGWRTASLHVKKAFLPVPRRDASRRLLMNRPPRVLIEAGVCRIWEVKKFLVQFARGTDQLGPFPGRRDGSISVGSQWSGLAVYVDDIQVTGEDAVACSNIRRFQDQWKCSSPEWLTPEHTLKFCRFEVSQAFGEFVFTRAPA